MPQHNFLIFNRQKSLERKNNSNGKAFKKFMQMLRQLLKNKIKLDLANFFDSKKIPEKKIQKFEKKIGFFSLA